MKLFLIGFMGCGKSYWAAKLGEKMKLPVVDLDKAIEDKEGKSISRIFAEDGEEYFRLLELDVLKGITESVPDFIMACGGGTPCYYKTIDYLNEKGTTVWIQCPPEMLYERLLKEKDKRPLLQALGDDEVMDYIRRKLASRSIYYRQAQVTVREDEATLDSMLRALLQSR